MQGDSCIVLTSDTGEEIIELSSDSDDNVIEVTRYARSRCLPDSRASPPKTCYSGKVVSLNGRSSKVDLNKSMNQAVATNTRTPSSYPTTPTETRAGSLSTWSGSSRWSEASLKSMNALKRLKSNEALDNDVLMTPVRLPTLAIPASPSKALIMMNLFNLQKKSRIESTQRETSTETSAVIKTETAKTISAPKRSSSSINRRPPFSPLQQCFQKTSRLIEQFLIDVSYSVEVPKKKGFGQDAAPGAVAAAAPGKDNKCSLEEKSPLKARVSDVSHIPTLSKAVLSVEDDGNSRSLANSLMYGTTAEECDVEPQPLHLEASSSQEQLDDAEETVAVELSLVHDMEPMSYRRKSRLIAGVSADTIAAVVRRAVFDAPLDGQRAISDELAADDDIVDFSYAQNALVNSYLDSSECHKMAAMWCFTNFVECGSRPSRKLLERLVTVFTESKDAVVVQHSWSVLSRLRTTIRWDEDDGHLVLWRWFNKCGIVLLSDSEHSLAKVSHDLLARFVVGVLENDLLRHANVATTQVPESGSLVEKLLAADVQTSNVLSILDWISNAWSIDTSYVESHVHHCQRMLNMSLTVSKNPENMIGILADRYCSIYLDLNSADQRRRLIEFVGLPTVKVQFLGCLLERRFEILPQHCDFRAEFSASKLFKFYFKAIPVLVTDNGSEDSFLDSEYTKNEAKEEDVQFDFVHILTNLLNAYAMVLTECWRSAASTRERKQVERQFDEMSQAEVAIDGLEAMILSRSSVLANNLDVQFLINSMRLCVDLKEGLPLPPTR